LRSSSWDWARSSRLEAVDDDDGRLGLSDVLHDELGGFSQALRPQNHAEVDELHSVIELLGVEELNWLR